MFQVRFDRDVRLEDAEVANSVPVQYERIENVVSKSVFPSLVWLESCTLAMTSLVANPQRIFRSQVPDMLCEITLYLPHIPFSSCTSVRPIIGFSKLPESLLGVVCADRSIGSLDAIRFVS